MPDVVRVSTPSISTGYEFAKVKLTFSWDAGATFPLGPVKVYEGSVGGAEPAPNKGTPVPFTESDPLTGLTVVGANVIGNEVDWPAARLVGGSAGTENGGVGLAVTRVIVVATVPEFMTVNMTFSVLPTAMDGKTTPVFPVIGMVDPFEEYERANSGPPPVPLRVNMSLPTWSAPVCGPTAVGV